MALATPSPIDRVLDALRAHGCNPRAGTNGEYASRCPAHEDRSPSLSVGENPSGNVLIFCHAGCATPNVARELGLSMADLFPAKPPKVPQIGPNGRIKAIYRYFKVDGELAFEVVRFDPKTFRQRRPDGHGGHLWNLKGVERIPYQLPQVVKAIRDGATIWVTEGEKDAENAQWFGDGVVATCNSGGAGKWTDSHAVWLQGAKEVRVIADDDEVGHDHARMVARSIRGIVGRVIVVLPAEGAKDLSEHMAKGHDEAALRTVWTSDQPTDWLDQVEVTEPPDEEDEDEDDLLPQPLDWYELAARETRGEEWLVDDFWPVGRAMSVTAIYKGGKSVLMFYVAACLAKGIDPWTRLPREPVIVGYWDLEQTEDDVHEHLVDFGFDPGELARFHYYLLPSIPPLDTAEGGRVVLDTLQRDGVQATIFDTFSRVLAGEENEASTINAYYRHTARPLKKAGIGSVRLDHVGHAAKDRARGSSDKGADVDVAWILRRSEGTGIVLDHGGVSRVRWVPRRLEAQLVFGPPDYYERVAESWPAGTADIAALLDRLGVPVDVGRIKARQYLKDADRKAPNDVLAAALRFRREAKNLSEMATDRSREHLSTDRFEEMPSDQDTDRSTDRSGQVICPPTDKSVSLDTDRSRDVPLDSLDSEELI